MNRILTGNRGWGTGTEVTSRRDLGLVENNNTHQPACRRYAAFKSLNSLNCAGIAGSNYTLNFTLYTLIIILYE
jgi:hypothetical protein